PPAQGVLDRDRERDLAGVDAGTADTDPALDQRPEHREEAPVRVVDVGDVDTGLGHVGVPVEQVLPRDADVVEPDPSVVDSVETDLASVVLDLYAGQHLPPVVTDRYDERMNALGRA